METKSVSFDKCQHSRVRHSPDGFNIIEECHECMKAWQIMGVTGDVILLPPNWMDRVMDRERIHNVPVQEFIFKKRRNHNVKP